MLKKILILSAFFISPLSHAVEYQSPRVLSLGGAGRATPFLHDTIYLNPSYASFAPIYSLSVGYNWFNAGGIRGRNYNASVQDSRTEIFQAGVGFTKREQNAAVNLGASKKIIESLSAGLGTKLILDNGTNKSTIDFMFSTTYIALPWMYGSFIIDNIFQSAEARLRNLYRTFYLGMKFIPTKEVLVYVDPLYSPSYAGGKKGGFSAGVELTLLADFYMRLGRFQDGEVAYANTRGEGYGMGVGYLGPKIHLDYAYHRLNSSHANLGLTTSHSIEMIIFF